MTLPCVVAVIVAAMSWHAPVSQDNKGRLTPGASFQRTLTPPQKHAYDLRLASGRSVKIVVVQKGIDAVVRVFAPGRNLVGTFDSPNGDQGPEPVSFISEAAGDYVIEVSALEPTAKEGRYEIRLEKLRAATRGEVEAAQSLKEVVNADDVWEESVAHVRAAAMDRIMADDYQKFRPQSGPTMTLGKSQFLDPYRKGTAKPIKLSVQKSIEERTIRVFGDTAVVMARISFKEAVKGKQIDDPMRVMHLWQKRKGQWYLVGDMVYPASPARINRIAVAVSPDVLLAISGTYDPVVQEAIIHVAPDGDHVILAVEDGGKIDLYPESDSEFFAKTENIQCTFVRDGQGRVTHLILVVNDQTIHAKRKG